jgi:hypothetical protein
MSSRMIVLCVTQRKILSQTASCLAHVCAASMKPITGSLIDKIRGAVQQGWGADCLLMLPFPCMSALYQFPHQEYQGAQCFWQQQRPLLAGCWTLLLKCPAAMSNSVQAAASSADSSNELDGIPAVKCSRGQTITGGPASNRQYG